MNLLLLAPLAVVLLVVAAIHADNKMRRLLVPGIALVLVIWIFSTPLTGNILIASLEDGVRDVECPEAESVVLLAGGLRGSAREPGDFNRLTEASLRRSIEAAAWLKGYPQLTVYVVGGYGWRVKEATVIVSFLELLDVENTQVPIVSARNTEESAQAMREELGDHAGPIALISSGYHLPRAMAEFERAGLDVCPVATDLRRSRLGGLGAIAPSPYALSKSRLALHEYAGLLAYKLRPDWPG